MYKFISVLFLCMERIYFGHRLINQRFIYKLLKITIMENELDLKMLKVSEMEKNELKDTNGGFILWALGVAAVHVAVEFATNPQAHIDAFNEGVEISKNNNR